MNRLLRLIVLTLCFIGGVVLGNVVTTMLLAPRFDPADEQRTFNPFVPHRAWA